jgi:hypothetical protein
MSGSPVGVGVAAGCLIQNFPMGPACRFLGIFAKTVKFRSKFVESSQHSKHDIGLCLKSHHYFHVMKNCSMKRGVS